MERACSRRRFDKLSLKKLQKQSEGKAKPDERISTIVLDESFENLKASVSSQRGDRNRWPSSPIVIDDSYEVENAGSYTEINSKKSLSCQNENSIPNWRGVNMDTSVTPKTGLLTVNFNEKSRPSPGGWSPAQEMICTAPKFAATPSSAKDIANESMEQCSIEKIKQSQKNILDELYGEVWRSIPTLFKKKLQKRDDNLDKVAKHLDFEDSDKENFDIFDTKNKYLQDLDRNFDKDEPPALKSDAEVKRKKKLFTEKYLDTPKTDVKRLKRELKTFTETKPKIDPRAITVNGQFPLVPEKPKVRTKSAVENKTVKSKAITEKPSELEVRKLSFMGSLADNVPTWRCDPTALVFKQNYKSKRDQLTRRLFVDFNRLVFDNGLEDDMPVVWDTKLRSTAGTTTNRLIKTSKLTQLRTSSIKLSSKVIDGPQRLRDTLVHEMCHAATWVLDRELRAGHGPLWKKWAKRALIAIPELEEISRCHTMQIHFKYSYKCTKCGYSVNRHSKSIDTGKKCCGYCRGTFELLVNKKRSDGRVVSTPARSGGPNDFALFVKENYAAHKNAARTHSQVMKILSEEYALEKKK